MAVRENMALAAMGLARSRRPGRTLTKVVNQIARKGVRVFFEFLPKKPPSGRPGSGKVRMNFHKGVVTHTMIATEGIHRP